jgi:hypothetical protein
MWVMGKSLFNFVALLALLGVACALFANRGFTVAYFVNQFMPILSGPSIPIGVGVLLVIVLVAVFK